MTNENVIHPGQVQVNRPPNLQSTQQGINQSLIRIATFSAYDLQMLRLQMGARLVANFRHKLGMQQKATTVTTGADTAPAVTATSEEGVDIIATEATEVDQEAQEIIDMLRASYRNLTEGVAKNRTIPMEKKFKGDSLITDYAELVLVDQFMEIEKREKAQFRALNGMLAKVDIFNSYLKHQIGIGPAMAAVLIAYLDPRKAHRISGFWSYCGVDVGPDGRGRSRRAEHLIDREYTKRDGTTGTKKSVTFNPWLKSRLLGVLCGSFLRLGSSWRRQYDNYKHRINSDPRRIKVTAMNFIKAFDSIKKTGSWTTPEGVEVLDATILWTPKRVHSAAMRYMLKMFLADLWVKWRTLEGLEVTPTYAEEKLGHVHGGGKYTPAA